MIFCFSKWIFGRKWRLTKSPFTKYSLENMMLLHEDSGYLKITSVEIVKKVVFWA